MQRRGAESRVAIWNVSHDDSLSFRNLSHGNGGVAMMGSPVAASIVASDACVDDELLCSNITRAERVFMTMNQWLPTRQDSAYRQQYHEGGEGLHESIDAPQSRGGADLSRQHLLELDPRFCHFHHCPVKNVIIRHDIQCWSLLLLSLRRPTATFRERMPSTTTAKVRMA